MTVEGNFIHLNEALRKIDDCVNKTQPKKPDISYQKLAAKDEDEETECYVFVDRDNFPCGSVLQRSIELTWELCEEVSVSVSKDGTTPQQVYTEGFLQTSNKSSLTNRFVDMEAGKTINANYLTNNNDRPGTVGEIVFLPRPKVNDFVKKLSRMLEIVSHQDIDALFKAYQDRCNSFAKAVKRPSKAENDNWYARNTLKGKPLSRPNIRKLRHDCHPDSWKAKGKH